MCGRVDGGKSDESLILKLSPKLVVKTYHFSIKVTGIKNISQVFGSVVGMADHYLLGKSFSLCDGCPIYFDVVREKIQLREVLRLLESLRSYVLVPRIRKYL